MMLLADVDPQQYVGFGIIGTILFLLNQGFHMLRDWKKERAAELVASLQAELTAKQNAVAMRKEELAMCTEEEGNHIKAYEALLNRTNTRLVDIEKELKEVYLKLESCQLALSHCQKDHAMAEERIKQETAWRKLYEEKVTLLETKYMALRKKVSGFDSDAAMLTVDEDKKPKSV